MLSFIYTAISVLISEYCGSFEIGKYFQFPGLIPHCKRILRLSKETWNADRQRAGIFTLEAFLEWSLNTVNKTFVDAPLKALLLQGIYDSKDFKTSTFGHLLFAKICLMIVYRCLKRHKIITKTALQKTDKRSRRLRLFNAYFKLPMHQQLKKGTKSEFENTHYKIFLADAAFTNTVDGFFSILEVCASSYVAGTRIRQLTPSMAFSICAFGLLHILNLRRSSRRRNDFGAWKTRAQRTVGSLFAFSLREMGARDLKIHGAKDWFLKTYETESKKVKSRIWEDPYKGVFDDCLDIVEEYFFPVSALLFGTGFDFNTYHLLQRSLASISLNVKNLKNTAEGMTEILPFAESYFRCLEMAKIVIPRIEEVEEPLEQIRSIELQSVSFSYDPPDTKPPEKKSTSATPTRRQLDNFTFTFEMGKVYSIIGKNGSGKSTLASILAKLNIPSEGKFLANGKDVKDISADIWLKQFGIMPQAFSHLSDFSVRDNIAFGSPALLERDIHNVVERQAKAFNVDTFTTPNTMFGDKTFSNQIPGTESESWTDDFSGGQWQSIALARTFCRSDSAHIFLLDEPSSALDPEREHGLFELLRRNKKERITIFISHSLRTCRASDCILVLERGKLVQSGSHAELIEDEDGTYARLNRLQTDTWSNEEDSALE